MAHKNLSALHEMAQNHEFCASQKVWNVVKERRKEKEEREEEKTNKQTKKTMQPLSYIGNFGESFERQRSICTALSKEHDLSGLIFKCPCR